MGTGIRVGKTADGRYVPIGHPEAKFLAYTEHDDVPDEVMEQLRPAPKQAAKPRDKAVKKTAAKKADDGAGV